MTVSTADARSKAVYSQLIKKVGATFPLSNLFTPIQDGEINKGESIDIPTRSAVTIQQVSNSSGAQLMSLQTNTPTANNLIVDQDYGATILLERLSKEFDMEGSWAQKMADQILIELNDYIDIDVYTNAFKTAAWDNGATPAYWVNAAAATLTNDMVEQTIALMTDQKGVRYEDLAWVFRPWGLAGLRRLSAFQPHENAIMGQLGMPQIGLLDGIPVAVSQSVPDQITVATSAVSITSNVATATVPTGHGIVVGMKVLNSGLTDSGTNLTAQTVSAVSATTVVFPYTGSNGAQADGVGTLTVNLTCNGLVNRPWLFVRKQQVPSIKMADRTAGYQGYELQFSAIWGRKALAGGMVMLGSPRQSVS